MRKFLAAAVLLLVSVPAAAQYDEGVYAKLFLAAGGVSRCVMRVGSGAPSGGTTCDTYIDYATGDRYQKIGGVWVRALTGSGTIGTVQKQTAAGVLGDSLLTESGSTVTMTGGFVGTTSVTTPKVYAYGTSPSPLALGGSGVVGCGSPPSAENCEALSYSFDSAFFEQRLKTDTAYRTQWYIGADGGHMAAYNASGWLPLRLDASPVQIGGGGLHVGSATVSDPGLGNSILDGYIGTPTYASQTTGWRIDGLGAADFRYFYTDELHAKKFVVDLEQALAGLQIIAKSVGQLGAAFTVPAGGSVSTLTMKDLPSAANMAVFESGDYVLVRQFSRASGSLSITNGYGIVTSYADQADGLQTWTFTRLVTNGGAMSTGAVLAIDTIILDLGVPGNGWAETNAVDGVYGINSPYTQIVTWSGDSPIVGNQIVRQRCGNLRGITSVTGEFGCVFGTYAASNGQYIKASTQGLELHGVDLKLWNSTTNVIRLDRATPYWSMGSPAPTTYSSGNGCWSGIDAGAFKWRCGDIAGGTNYIAWDGGSGTLSVKGNITITGSGINADSLVGTAGATVVSGAALGTLGLDANGNPLLPHTATPSGTGLFLGSDYFGLYTGGVWKNFFRSNGDVYFGGTGGAFQFVGSTGALTLSATLSGNGSGITAITGGNITTGTVTATQIAAGTITATQIATGTITTGNLAFTPVSGTNVLATINASAEGIKIAGNRISIDGNVTFTSGYDPTTKVASGGSAADVNAGGTTISGGKITANSITASQITANTITTGQINFSPVLSGGAAADVNAGGTTISGGKITANSITASQITALTITGSELAADSITSAKIVAGTIVASDIATGTITADKLTVGTLSAISANLGTVTAGSITGATATFGGSGGDVTLDSSGILITAGTNAVNRFKFDNGSFIQGMIGTDAILVLNSGSNGVWLQLNNSGLAILDAVSFGPAVGNAYSNFDLGKSGGRWKDLYLSGYANIDTLTSGTVCANQGTLLMCGPPDLDAVVERLLADPRFVDALARAMARLEGTR